MKWGSHTSNSDDRRIGEYHIFLEPNRTYAHKPKPIGGFPPTYFHTEDEATSLEEHIETVISESESKELGDENIYYVLDLRISRNHPIVTKILRRLNAKVLAELDENQILATSTLSDFKAARPDMLRLKTVRDNLFAIHQLRFDNIVDSELEISESAYLEPKTLTFHMVPNIGVEKATRYITQTIEYFKSNNVPVESSWMDPETGSSSLNAHVTRSQLSDVVEKTSFFFKIHEKIKIHTVKPMTQRFPKDIQIVKIDRAKIEALPEVCIIDTGLNIVPQLRGLIVKRVAEAPITSPDDLNDHGTPVASLAVYGDNISGESGALLPLARVISHKVLSPTQISDMAGSMSNAISQNADCRTFSCSLSFIGTRLAFMVVTQRINVIAQRSNRAIIFSAGNIDPDDLIKIISFGIRYPDYLNNACVSHPSDAPFVFSVGACTKYSLPDSVAPANAPSPFTTYRTSIIELRECPKPELVEHGGNVCYINGKLNCSGTGVRTFSNRGQVIEKIGTSMSAPLVAQQMARIWNYFGNRIKNVETVKAILLSTCNPTMNHPRFAGFGEPNKDELFQSKTGVARVVFEGSLPIIATVQEEKKIPADEIKVFVPADIEKIEIFLVHSDNYQLNAFPRLNSYIKVIAEKPGKKGSVIPNFGKASSPTYVKYLVYKYKRNIKGDWFFRFLPTMMSLPAREREHLMIRYGGVIKMTAKTPRSGVSQSVIRGLRRGRRIQIPLDSST